MSKSLKMFLKPQGTGACLGQTDGQTDAGNNNTLSAWKAKGCEKKQKKTELPMKTKYSFVNRIESTDYRHRKIFGLSLDRG